MLAKFAVENFRGFKDKIEIDLTRCRNFEFNQFAIKDGIIKNGIIYGPNGSGKSNFSMSIFDIVYHLTQKFKNPSFLTNYTYAGNQTLNVKFWYTFCFDGKMVEYHYVKDFRGVLMEEYLAVDGKPVFEKKQKDFWIDVEEFPMDNVRKENLSENANNVSIVNYLLASYPLNKEHYLLQMNHFVNSMLWFRCLEEREFIGLETNIYLLDEFIISNNLVDEFAKFLLDVSNQHFDFIKPVKGDRYLFVRIDGEALPFNPIASTGTHSLMLLFFWLKHLSAASFVFIDEFDAFYHYKLSRSVCEILFKEKCQLFLSSHNTFLMTNDLLRPDCNFILENNKISPICDATDKELREGHNIEKLYRGGTFNL